MLMTERSADAGTPASAEGALVLLRTIRYVGPVLLGAIALVATILYSAQFDPVTAVGIVGLATMVGMGAAAGGAVLGFLFGIPRYAGGESGVPRAGNASLVSGAWSHNTNLQQVSDWLTKILVGVGLTQFRGIAATLGELFVALGPSLGGASKGAVFGGCVVTYCSLLGFMISYVLTTGTLPRYLIRQHALVATRPLGPGYESGPSGGQS